MSIPLTASTEAFTPECMAEIEGAPRFTFRHATVLDTHRYHNLVIEEGLRYHSKPDVRAAIIEELRAEFTSEGMEHNITRLEAYWDAIDALEAAETEHLKHIIALRSDLPEGADLPELPPAPVIDFPEEEIAALDQMVDEVREQSPRIRKMLAQNHWHGVQMPRLFLRMYLTATTLPVKLKKADGMLTAETAEQIIEALAAWAREHGVKEDDAIGQLQAKAMLSFRLTEDEEKNSSSPPSDTTTPERSAKKQSSGPQAEVDTSSNDPATSEEVNGSTS